MFISSLAFGVEDDSGISSCAILDIFPLGVTMSEEGIESMHGKMAGSEAHLQHA